MVKKQQGQIHSRKCLLRVIVWNTKSKKATGWYILKYLVMFSEASNILDETPRMYRSYLKMETWRSLSNHLWSRDLTNESLRPREPGPTPGAGAGSAFPDARRTLRAARGGILLFRDHDVSVWSGGFLSFTGECRWNTVLISHASNSVFSD